MEAMPLRMFQRQVKLQCEFAMYAVSGINIELSQRNIEGVFYNIQNFLTAAANISKVLWGAKGRKGRYERANQRKELRESIDVLDDSPLRDVNMRNKFEHFDESIDKWWRESSRHNFVDLNITQGSIVDGADDKDVFRNFNPRTTDITFWSEKFNIQIIVNEIQLIIPLLEIETIKPYLEK